MTRLLAPLLLLLSAPLLAQNPRDRVEPRVTDQRKHEEPDGTVSVIQKGRPSNQHGALSVTPGPAQVKVSFVIDDAGECNSPQSVVHHIDGDTISVTLYYTPLAVCPGIVTPREYHLSLTGLKPRGYVLVMFFGYRGGPSRPPRREPWLTVHVSPMR